MQSLDNDVSNDFGRMRDLDKLAREQAEFAQMHCKLTTSNSRNAEEQKRCSKKLVCHCAGAFKDTLKTEFNNFKV